MAEALRAAALLAKLFQRIGPEQIAHGAKGGWLLESIDLTDVIYAWLEGKFILFDAKNLISVFQATGPREHTGIGHSSRRPGADSQMRTCTPRTQLRCTWSCTLVWTWSTRSGGDTRDSRAASRPIWGVWSEKKEMVLVRIQTTSPWPLTFKAHKYSTHSIE